MFGGAHVASAELLAHWSLDEVSGETAKDVSGNGQDAELIAGAVWYPEGGRAGGALTLDGKEEYLSAPGLLSGTSSFTVAGWVAPSGLNDSFVHANSAAIRFWVDTRSDRTRSALQLITENGDRSEFLEYPEGAVRHREWNHVAGTWDGKMVRLYVGGELQDEVAFDADEYGPLKSIDELGIGKRSTNTYAWFDGVIDDVRVYDTALDADSLAAIMAEAPGDPLPPSPHAIPTFESIGLYWSPEGGETGRAATVRFRPQGDDDWREGQPLWFDVREGQGEYRGSLVELEPGLPYDVELTLAEGGEVETLVATTWPEELPVAETVILPTFSGETLKIDRSGTADGYLLYTHAEGDSAIIDVADSLDNCVEIRGSYVIVRGLSLRNGSINGARLLEGAQDVVIEECDITGWGRVASDGWGEKDNDAAVMSNSRFLSRLVVQRNRLHHPRADSNNWEEYREIYDSAHPWSPLAIALSDSKGNNVVRYNEAFSDADHYFGDIFGGGKNRIPAGNELSESRGFPGADSDIYGNIVTHCWDDGIESEGSNRNVRIWGNFTDRAFCHIAIAPVEVGPIYVWRNVSSVGATSDTMTNSAFLKTDCDEPFGCGRSYVYHNTILYPPESGANVGIGWGSLVTELVSRNNVLHNLRKSGDPGTSIRYKSEGDGNDYDYDLCAGNYPVGTEPNGLDGEPSFEADAPSFDVPSTGVGSFQLDPESLGYDQGIPLPNFNDGARGEGPDMGAHEAGTAAMEFGVDAYRSVSAADLQVFVDKVPDCVRPGERLKFEAGVRNAGTISGAFDEAALVVGPPFELALPLYAGGPLFIEPEQSVATTIVQPVPPTLAPGIYDLAVAISMEGEELARAAFQVDVNAGCE